MIHTLPRQYAYQEGVLTGRTLPSPFFRHDKFSIPLNPAQVHGGGKRLRHEFRALYDYYGKRVDYGEGEFPSKWPTDMAQVTALVVESALLLPMPRTPPTQRKGVYMYAQDVTACHIPASFGFSHCLDIGELRTY